MTEWQPIETAPKDGTEILAYDSKNKKYAVGYVSKNFQEFFLADYDFEDGPSYDEGMTHWMPLPEPPHE